MSSTNTACIDGYLGADSKLTYSQSGFAFLNFSIPVKSQIKNGEKWEDRTDWIDCKALGKRAEGLAKILKKGTFCVVSGRLQQEKWEDKDGGKRSKIVLLAENVSLGPKRDGGSGGGGSHSDSGGDPGYESGGPNEDDIPF